jgi:hypothetical protein
MFSYRCERVLGAVLVASEVVTEGFFFAKSCDYW